MRLRRIWWICDGCGREDLALHRPGRCRRDRLGKHPVMRPMGPKFVDLAARPGRSPNLFPLLAETGMSLHSIGPMLLSRLTAQEDGASVGPPVPNPCEDGRT